MRNFKGGVWGCEDANAVGECIEAAIWPLIQSPLKNRKKIKITISNE